MPATVAEIIRSACGPGGSLNGLERRIERQVTNLEAGDATPALRRRAGARIAELEGALEERRQHADTLAARASEAPPTAADLATAPGRLPVLANRLHHLLQPEFRALFDSLQMRIAFQPRGARYQRGGNARRR